MSGLRVTLRRMNPTRSVLVVALALALPLVLSACGNKGPLVRATPVPATIDGTPTIDAPVEGEPAEDADVEEATVEDTDPSDEITLPDEEVPAESGIAPPEDEPTPEPAPETVPPAEDPNG